MFHEKDLESRCRAPGATLLMTGDTRSVASPRRSFTVLLGATSEPRFHEIVPESGASPRISCQVRDSRCDGYHVWRETWLASKLSVNPSGRIGHSPGQ